MADPTVLGVSPAFRAALDRVRKVAPTDMTVLLQGESGTGKEVVAGLLHRSSLRYGKPFVPVDCGALSEHLAASSLFGHEKGAYTGADHARQGSIESAHGGTLFLDEIGNAPLAVQMKLLRVLQEKKLRRLGGTRDIAVDVRIVAASNVDMEAAVHAGVVRGDLLHRVRPFTIALPPLRDRREDIPLLAHHFLREAIRQCHRPVVGFSAEAVAKLVAARWPGNVRELKYTVERAVVLAQRGTITPREIELHDQRLLPATTPAVPAAAPSPSLRGKVTGARTAIEREEIERALRATGGNIAKAARMLQMARSTLYVKIKRYSVPLAKPLQQPNKKSDC